MKQLFMVTYTYRKTDEVSNRELVKRFLEHGQAAGIITQYERLDGKGGVFFTEAQSEDALVKNYELTLLYGEYLEFSITPVAAFDEALPTILKTFG